MTDLFADKAADYDDRPVPQQISAGVFAAIQQNVALSPELSVLDFGAGTGLVSVRLAPLVKHILAVDVSAAMLDKLTSKPGLADKVTAVCQDITKRPLDRQFELVVSAMAMHHVDDTSGLLNALFNHVTPGGQVALADLDKEDGHFHPPGIHGVHHSGFERPALAEMAERAGFTDVAFVTACEIDRDGRPYPIFLMTATRP